MKAKELALNEVLNVGAFFSPTTIQDFLTLNRWLSKGLFGMFQGYVECFLDLSYLVFSPTHLTNMHHHRQIGWFIFPLFFLGGWTFRKVSCHQIHPGNYITWNLQITYLPRKIIFQKIFQLPAAYGNVLRTPLKDVCFLWGWTAKDIRISDWGVWICFFCCSVLLHLQNPYATSDSHFILRAGGFSQTSHLYLMCLWIHPGRLTAGIYKSPI